MKSIVHINFVTLGVTRPVQILKGDAKGQNLVNHNYCYICAEQTLCNYAFETIVPL